MPDSACKQLSFLVSGVQIPLISKAVIFCTGREVSLDLELRNVLGNVNSKGPFGKGPSAKVHSAKVHSAFESWRILADLGGFYVIQITTANHNLRRNIVGFGKQLNDLFLHKFFQSIH